MAQKTLSIKLSLNDKQFQSSLRKATRSLKRFGSSMKRTGQTLSTTLTLPLLALGATSVKIASDFEETQSKFNTVFKDISEQANNTAKNLEKDFGLSSRAAMQLLGDTGDLLTGFGFTQEEALKLSNEVNKLAVDLASFTNFSGGAEGASLALTKALLGERESIKSLGIAITEADLKSFAEEQGLVFKELDRVAKATLTFQLAARQSVNAIGDYERTSGSFANQTRKLRGDIENLGVQIGQKLLPIAQKIINKFKDIIEVFTSMSNETQNMVLGFALITGAIGPFLIVIGSLLTTLIAIGAKFFLISTAVVALASGIAFVVDNFEAFKERLTLDFFFNSIVMGVQSSLRAFGNLIKGYNKLIDKIGGGKLDFLKASNELEKLADNLEGLKVPTKDNEHEFKSFGESMGNTIDKILPKFGELFNAISGDTNKGSSTSFKKIPSKKPSSSFGVMTPAVIPDDLLKQMELFEEQESNINSITKDLSNTFGQFGNILQSTFAQALQSTDGFFKTFVDGAKQAFKALMAQVAAMLAMKVILNAVGLGSFSELGGGLGGFLGGLGIPGLANGGLATGPSIAMVGEGPGTSMSNPEVIAPLDKLKSMIGQGNGSIEVFGSISGQDILLSSTRARNNRTRTRGY